MTSIWQFRTWTLSGRSISPESDDRKPIELSDTVRDRDHLTFGNRLMHCTLPLETELMSVDFNRTIQEDHIYQQRMWRAYRIGWIIMIVLLLCALNGLVSEGPASQVHGEHHTHQNVSYDRVDRGRSPIEIQRSVNMGDKKSSSVSHDQSETIRSSLE